MRIIDLTRAYLETVGSGRSLVGYERSFPALFEQYFLFWADRKLFSLSLTQKEVEERLVMMRSRLPSLEEKLKTFGFETENITLVLFVGQNTSNGHAFEHEGKWYVWLPLETYETDSQRDVFVTHEIIHAVHYMNRPEFFFKTIREKNDVGRELITEGLATYFTMKVLGCSLEEALWADYASPDEVEIWLSQCRARESELCQFALRAWQGDEATELFYANDPGDILKYRAGYYLGVRVMEEILERGLKTEHDLLRLERKEFERLCREVLMSLSHTNFRKEIARVVTESEEAWWKPEPFQQRILQIIPSEIEIVALPPEEEKNYNCFVFALGFQNDELFLGKEAWEFTRNLGEIFDAMIRRELFILKQNPEVGDMVLYRTSSGEISHVGLLQQDGRILSKWSWGPLLKHEIFDTPDFYGDAIEWYALNDQAKEFVRSKLKEFLQENL